MKQLIFLWGLLILLAGCAGAPSEPEVPEIQPVNQGMACAAASQIMESFVDGPTAPIVYPEEYGGGYIAEDFYLYICLTDNSAQTREKYRSIVEAPEILRFTEVNYSLNDLRELQDALTDERWREYGFTGIGVDEIGNQVNVCIEDLSRAEELRPLMVDSLSPELRARFPEPPLIFEEMGPIILC